MKNRMLKPIGVALLCWVAMVFGTGMEGASCGGLCRPPCPCLSGVVSGVYSKLTAVRDYAETGIASEPVVLEAEVRDQCNLPVQGAVVELYADEEFPDAAFDSIDIATLTLGGESGPDGIVRFRLASQHPAVVQIRARTTKPGSLTTLQGTGDVAFFLEGNGPHLTAKAGWNLYDCAAGNGDPQGYVAATRRQRPALVRWFVELDRYEEAFDWSAYSSFLEALDEANATLVVQLWVQYYLRGWSLSTSCRRYLPCLSPISHCSSCASLATCSWHDISRESIRDFVQGLSGALAEYPGIQVIWGAFNEVDLRWGTRWDYAAENYNDPWFLDNFRKKGSSRWTGGSGDIYADFHSQIDVGAGGAVFSSNGVITSYNRDNGSGGKHRSYRWLQATAPWLGYVDLHLYRGVVGPGSTVEEWISAAARRLAAWDVERPEALPFFIGEYAESGKGDTAMNEKEAAAARERHQAASARFPKRYLGMAWHGVGGQSTASGWWVDP